MQFGAQRPSGRLISLTPLIDVVFILLVFFMLAASFLDWRAVDLNVAGGVSTATAGEGGLLIGLAADGSTSVGAVTVMAATGTEGAAALRNAVARALGDDPSRRIVIRAEPGVPLQRAIDTLDIVRALGARDVSLSRKR